MLGELTINVLIGGWGWREVLPICCAAIVGFVASMVIDARRRAGRGGRS